MDRSGSSEEDFYKNNEESDSEREFYQQNRENDIQSDSAKAALDAHAQETN